MATVRNPRKTFNDNIIRWVRENIETIEPATVLDVSMLGTDRIVTVQPNVMQDKGDGDIVKAPAIEGCPVILQGTQEGYMSFPIKQGDTVAIGYTKDLVEDFTYSSETVPYEPTDTRLFGCSEAVVLGYWGQPSKDLPISTDNFEIKYYDGCISISPQSEITLDNGVVLQKQNDNWSVTAGSFSIVFNSDGSASIDTSGVLSINGTTFEQGGVVGGITSLTAGGKELVEHIHNVTTGSSAGPVSPNV